MRRPANGYLAVPSDMAKDEQSLDYKSKPDIDLESCVVCDQYIVQEPWNAQGAPIHVESLKILKIIDPSEMSRYDSASFQPFHTS